MKKMILGLAIFMAGTTAIFAQEAREFTLEDIFKKGTFAQKVAPGFNVMNDGVSYSVMESEDENNWKIVRYDLATGAAGETIFSSKNLSQKLRPESYEFSEDETHLLVTMGTERIFRHSTKALAYIINIAKSTITPISDEKVMYPTMSPDNSKVAWVMNNNLYSMEIASGKITEITTDGKENEIINGAVDWVYEEEFSMSVGFAWSPDSKYIAYYRFDESQVKEFGMTIFGDLYPSDEVWKYPKAGEDNSKVTVHIYNLEMQRGIACETFSDDDIYLPRIQWTEFPGVLSVQRLNRTQNYWELLHFHADRGKPVLILADSAKTYIDISDNLHYIKGTTQLLYTSEKDGFNHIYCYDTKKEKEKQITSGNFDVVSIKGVDDAKGIIYYTSSEVSPTEDHFYSIKINGKDKKKLSAEAGNHSITMGKGNVYYTDMNSVVNSPNHFVLKRTSDNWSRVLEGNKSLDSLMHLYRFGSTEFSSLTTASGVTLNYWIMKPANFDPSKKYPVLMHVYGGPGHNTVRNSYAGRNYLWHQYLTQKGYIVVSVDNRGTGNRGREFKHSTYLQLGKLELQDQTEAARWFASQPYVDASRIGIWGWSFGGYMSSLCISKSADVFKTAIAVAPVTNWRFYDNIYTERFLRKPQDNEAGYDENSPINFVNGIKGNYLIIHGTGDDNVHFQNSVEMVNAMIRAGVKFDSEFYPNRNHGIGDRAAQYHLYRRMTDYLLENL